MTTHVEDEIKPKLKRWATAQGRRSDTGLEPNLLQLLLRSGHTRRSWKATTELAISFPKDSRRKGTYKENLKFNQSKRWQPRRKRTEGKGNTKQKTRQ